jgi:broad specificity phosphatase PhoE
MEIPQDGESIYQFEARTWPLLAAMVQLGWEQGVPCICVAHSSIVHTLNHLLNGHVDHAEVAVDPGGVIEVFFENGEIMHAAVFRGGNDDSSFRS